MNILVGFIFWLGGVNFLLEATNIKIWMVFDAIFVINYILLFFVQLLRTLLHPKVKRQRTLREPQIPFIYLWFTSHLIFFLSFSLILSLILNCISNFINPDIEDLIFFNLEKESICIKPKTNCACSRPINQFNFMFFTCSLDWMA